jgi:hypothetical protein
MSDSASIDRILNRDLAVLGRDLNSRPTIYKTVSQAFPPFWVSGSDNVAL